MSELSKLTSDYDIVKARIVNDLNSSSEAFQVLSNSSTANSLSGLLAGICALWNHKIEQASLNLFMDSAYGRQTVYSLAKTKGYTPANKIPARCSIKLDISNISTYVSIPSGTPFVIGDYRYYTDDTYGANPGDTYLDINVIQGINISESFTTTGTAFDYFDFSEDFSLTEGSVEAYIDGVKWTNHGTSLMGTTSDDKVYIVNNNSDGTSTLTFGNGTFGVIPTSSSSLLISYYQNVGSKANTTTVGITATSVDGRYNGVTTTTIYGGKEEQDTESIKYTANKLAYTDDNQKLITRKNFSGYLYRQYDILDGKAWGAYEETMRVDPDVTQMNKIWYTVVPPDCTPVTSQAGTTSASTTNSGTITTVPILPGSTVITYGTKKFTEASGGIGIMCEDETTVTYNSGTAYANYNSGTASYMFDANLNNYYDAGHTPTEEEPVIVGIRFTTPANIRAIRIRSIATQDSTKIASPKTIKIYGTTEVSPDYTHNEGWITLGYISDLGLILSNTWSRWIGVDDDSVFTALKFVVTASTTTDLRISEIQLQTASQISTINYTTGAFITKSQVAPASRISRNASVVLDSIEPTYINSITEDLTSRTLFTTIVNYKKPVVRAVDIYMNLFYSASYDGSTVMNEVTEALNTLFKVPTKMLGAKLTLSDLYYTIRSVAGVTSVDIISPTYNSVMDTNEFPVLNSLTINMEIYND